MFLLPSMIGDRFLGVTNADEAGEGLIANALGVNRGSSPNRLNPLRLGREVFPLFLEGDAGYLDGLFGPGLSHHGRSGV